MKECKQVNELLDEYLDQRLSPKLANLVEQHLYACPACRREYETWLEIKALMTESRDGEIPSKHYFERLFINLLPALKPGGWGQEWLDGFRQGLARLVPSYSFRRAMAVASLVIIGFIGGLIIARQYLSTPAPTAPVLTGASAALDKEPGDRLLASAEGSRQASPEIKQQIAHELGAETPGPPAQIIKSPLDMQKVKTFAKNIFSQAAVSPKPEVAEGSRPGLESVSSMSPEIKRLRSVASELEGSQILDTIQNVKFHLYVSGKEEFIPAFHQVEDALTELTSLASPGRLPEGSFSDPSLARGKRPDRGVVSQLLGTYQEAENAVLRKDYGQAREKYYQVVKESPDSYLAFLSYLQIADIEFEVLENYKSALENYKTCLTKSDINYAPLEIRNHIISRIELLGKNSQDDWRPLRLYIKAIKSQPDTAIALYKDLITNYPATSLAEEAIKGLTNFTLDWNYADLIRPEETVRLFQEQLGQSLNVTRKQLLQLAIADIFNFRLHNKGQALLEYSRVVNMGEENSPELVRTARYRIRNIHSSVPDSF